MALRFVDRRMIWWPTILGWSIGGGLLALCLFTWAWWGESFLSATRRVPAECLVVEGWIGLDGVRAAAAEFNHGGYQWIVTSGGPTDNRWGHQKWNHAILAREELLRIGVPDGKIVQAPAAEVQSHRTFEAAAEVARTLQARGIDPKGLNIFTFGAHARRSRLVYAKVFPQADVGVVSWVPFSQPMGPWWQSSERAGDLLKETLGWSFEALANSGRTSNSPLRRPR